MMRSVAICLCLLGNVLASGARRERPPERDITVILDFERSRSSLSIRNIEQELDKILAPVNVRADVRLKGNLPSHFTSGDLIVFRMRGNCSAQPVSVGAVSDERGPLAMTYSVDGAMLPFGEVLCDRLNRTLSLGQDAADPTPLALAKYRRAYGLAVARVMAHEMYHMISKSPEHDVTGPSKSSFSPADLGQGELRFANGALGAARQR